VLLSADNGLVNGYSIVVRGPQNDPIVMLCGYYGEHNLGDDALLSVLLEELPSEWHPCITAFDRNSVLQLRSSASVVQRRSLFATARALMSVDALVLGGGSLLQDSTSLKSLLYYLGLLLVARCKGIPVILWGQGLGPLRRRVSRCLVRWLVPSVTSISWRDAGSLEIARRWQFRVPMLMAADPVWSYPSQPWRGDSCGQAERTGIVLCWRPTALLDQEGWLCLLQVVERLAEQHQLPVTWLAFHQHQDDTLPTTLKEKGFVPASLRRRSRFETAQSLDQVLGLMSRAQLVLPMRLHALILAQLAGAPCAALSYDPKVAAAAGMADIDCIDLANLPPGDQLERRWQAQFMRPPNQGAIDAIKTDAARHGEMLRKTLLSLAVVH